MRYVSCYTDQILPHAQWNPAVILSLNKQLPCSFIFWAQYICDNDGLIFHAACLVPLLQDQKLVANSGILVLFGRGMTSFNKMYGVSSHS